MWLDRLGMTRNPQTFFMVIEYKSADGVSV